MQFTPAKILLSSIAIGGAGTGGFFAFRHLSKKEESIREVLKNEGIELISSLVVSKAQYELEYESDKDLIKKEINYQGDKKEEGGVKLKAWCDSKLNLPSKDNRDLISKMKKWCSIRTVADQLSRAGKTLLTKSSKNENWTAVWEALKQSRKDRTKVGLTNSQWGEKESNSDDINIMQKWCTGKGGEKFLASNKEEIYNLVESWCSVNTETYVK